VVGLVGRPGVADAGAGGWMARARQRLHAADHRCEWQGAPNRLEARSAAYEINAGNQGAPTPGFGRISKVRLNRSDESEPGEFGGY